MAIQFSDAALLQVAPFQLDTVPLVSKTPTFPVVAALTSVMLVGVHMSAVPPALKIPQTTHEVPALFVNVSAGQLGVVLLPLVEAVAPIATPFVAQSCTALAPVPVYPESPTFAELLKVPLAAAVAE